MSHGNPDPTQFGVSTPAEIKAVRALADGESTTLNGFKWTRDDSLEHDEAVCGGWVIDDGPDFVLCPVVPYF